MDNFYELLVSTKKSLTYKIANISFYVLILLAVMFMRYIFVFLLYAVLALAAFLIKKTLYVEYEYIFTNGEIDVDKILEMKKRKRVITFNIKNVELLAPEGSAYLKEFYNKPSKVLSLYPKDNSKQVYVAMVTGGNQRLQLRFVPNEELLDLCYKYNPRAVKKI